MRHSPSAIPSSIVLWKLQNRSSSQAHAEVHKTNSSFWGAQNLLTSTVKKRTHVCRACLSVPVEPCPRLPTSISRRALLCSLPSVLPPCAYARHALPWGRQCPPPLCPQPATPLLAQALQPPSSCCLNAPFPLPWNAGRLGRNQVGSLIREVIAEDT